MDSKGTFIVIEGSDGSGKGTQFNLLRARLEAVGYDVQVFDFPRYDQDSSYFVRQYLNGKYGPAKNVSPYTASLFYALDRYEAGPKIRKALEEGKVVLCNRYVGSNMAHQGGKFEDSVEQRSFFVWEDGLEYQLLNIPRPSINLFLKVPAEMAQTLIAKKNARSYTDKSHDEHEADINHLKKSVATYELLCKLFPNDFKLIDCVADGQLLDIPKVNNLIWEQIKPLLPAKPSKPARPMVVKLSETPQNPSEEKPTTGKLDKNVPSEIEVRLSLAAAYEAALAGLPLKLSDFSWASQGFEYFTPEDLPKKTLLRYQENLNHNINLQKSVSKKIAAEAKKSVLAAMTPLAALLSFKISAPGENASEVLNKLSTSTNKEVRTLAKELKSKFKLSATQTKSSDVQDPEAVSNIIARIAAEALPQNLPTQTEAVELIEAFPRNEFKILADVLYPFSNLAKNELGTEIDAWSYDQKSEALAKAVAAGSDVLTSFSYRFDVTADRALLGQLLQANFATSIRVQPATPRFGYDVAEHLDEFGAADEFESAFDKSLELFSILQAAGREDLAAYAVLVGHKARFEVCCTLKALNERLSTKNLPELAKLINEMLEKVGVQHGVAVAAMVRAQISAKQTPAAKPKTETKAAAKQAPKKNNEAKEASKNQKPESRSSRSGRRRGNKPKKP